MSLVAYGSSDESDSEETSTSVTAGTKPSTRGLLSHLPAPKTPSSVGGDDAPNKETTSCEDDIDPQLSKGGLFSALPKPKKRTEPVKISVPQVQKHDVSTG